MKAKGIFPAAAPAVGLLILILDSQLALEGARRGLALCLKTVIPSLFPFFVLSLLLTSSLQGWDSPVFRLLGKALGLSPNAALVLIPAFLGGYPVGAKCVGDLYMQKRISREEANRLLHFCSNAGPSFLFGMVGAFFPERKTVWLLWLIQILSAVLTAAALPAVPGDHRTSAPGILGRPDDLMLSAAKAMALVCCWVILFRMVLTFLDAWFLWRLPQWARVLVMGALELTNGCCELLSIENVPLRFVLCCAMVSLGGLCVVFQTASVIRGLSLGDYLRGKLIQTAFSILLSAAFLAKQGPALLAAVPVLVMILRKTEKRYGNPRQLPV